VPVPRFGSSDCTCPAHLIALAEETIPAELTPVTVIKMDTDEHR
jgi:Uri superfamily endonuclease